MQGNSFSYTYSAPTEAERREIESIKSRFATSPAGERSGAPASEKLNRLRYLTKKAAALPRAAGWALGVVGTLTMGGGMAMVLEAGMLIFGTAVGVAGIALLSVAYPVYKAVLKLSLKKYGGEIASLCEELLNGGD